MTSYVLVIYGRSIYTYMARIIISLPVELLQELDVYTKERKYNRSECIRHAIRMMVQNQQQQEGTNHYVAHQQDS